MKRKSWIVRLSYELKDHLFASFVTLTYDDSHVPMDNSVSKRDLQLFFKRLRKNSELQFRYYAVGEYGSNTNRPHYHAIIFGLNHLTHSSVVHSSWKLGFVSISDVSEANIQYITKNHILGKIMGGIHPPHLRSFLVNHL